MNEFYIFSVKQSFYKLYKNNPGELFYVYNRIYNMKKSDKDYGYNLFCQVSNFLDKKYVNNIIKEKYKDKIMYSNSLNEHIINNLFLNEISILTVKNCTIKIESNVINPSFFDNLKDTNMYLFVCDFKNKNYFFINKKRSKVK